MAKNSLFAVLLRSPWWVSLAIALVIGLVAAALLPADLKVVGALSGAPFIVIAAIAAWRQSMLPNAARVEATTQAVAAMAWPEFAQCLEAGFRDGGFSVEALSGGAADFRVERDGRSAVVSARRWKTARTGQEGLRALQQAREAAEVQDAIYIALGELTDNARPFATQHSIMVWQAAEIALLLRKLPLPGKSAR